MSDKFVFKRSYLERTSGLEERSQERVVMAVVRGFLYGDEPELNRIERAVYDDIMQMSGRRQIEQTARECRMDFEKFGAYFNAKVASGRIPCVKWISDERKSLVLNRLKAYSKKDLMTVIDKAAASSFLNGDNNRNFVASFDWIFGKSAFQKILEGNYDDKR